MERLFVIKIGGNVLDDPASLAGCLAQFAGIADRKILVHGGGRIATRIGEQMGIKAIYVDGRRVTDEPTLNLVTMVYGGLVNKQIVAKLQALGSNSIGLTGADARIIPALKRIGGETDFGFAGEVNPAEVSADTCRLLLEHGLVPVFAPLTFESSGQMLNTNADTIASALAIALAGVYRVRLIYCFEKKGVLERPGDDQSVIPRMNQLRFDSLKAAGILTAGILPKLENAFEAIRMGVAEVLIGEASQLALNTTDKVTGTLIF
ncbi:MAG TPA: acetylglutamate kinase [Chitinophagaceae bacterium]|nr:acetylglutamate kinase [Chitinophagaceae bacterium]